jgi:hypothetical protein
VKGLAFDLIRAGLKHGGERIASDGDLDLEVDDLLALSQTLATIARVAARARVEVDEAAAALIGPGVAYRYGDHVVAWKHGYKWQAYKDTARFVVSAARSDPEWVLELFNVNGIRKTGVEKVAKRMGLDPEMVVSTVLSKTWEDAPRLQWKWQPEQEDSNDRNDRDG